MNHPERQVDAAAGALWRELDEGWNHRVIKWGDPIIGEYMTKHYRRLAKIALTAAMKEKK